MLRQLPHFFIHLAAAAFDDNRNTVETLLIVLNPVERCVPGQGLDTAHARCYAGLGNDLEQPDVAGALHVGATA